MPNVGKRKRFTRRISIRRRLEHTSCVVHMLEVNIYCRITWQMAVNNKDALGEHCIWNNHKNVVVDEEKKWKTWRS